MTISFALLNEQGIVMAADHAMKNKLGIHTKNMQKVFEVTPHHPVGIMIYKHHNYYNISIESIIQLYRSEIKNVYYDHTEDYFNSFIDFIETKLFESFDLKDQEEKFIQDFITDKLMEIQHHLADLENWVIQKYHLTSESEINEALLEHGEQLLDYELKELEKKVLLDSFTGDDELALFKAYENGIISYIENEFKVYAENWLYKIVTIIVQHLLKSLSHKPIGIVVAGYGKKDLFPAIFRVVVDGRVNGKLRYDHYKSTQISSDNSSAFFALTDTKKISNIITGIDQTLEEELYKIFINKTETHGNKLLRNLQEKFPDNQKISSKVRNEFQHFMYHLKNNVDTYKANQFHKPFLKMLDNCSVDELVYIAELLMNAEIFGSDMTSKVDREDVMFNIASITKADHFVSKRMNK